jgi:hypothetical protein
VVLVVLIVLSVSIVIVIVAVLRGSAGIVNLKTFRAHQLTVQVDKIIDCLHKMRRIANLAVRVLIVDKAVICTASDTVAVATLCGKHPVVVVVIVVIIVVVVVVVVRVRGKSIHSGGIQRARKRGKAGGCVERINVGAIAASGLAPF